MGSPWLSLAFRKDRLSDEAGPSPYAGWRDLSLATLSLIGLSPKYFCYQSVCVCVCVCSVVSDSFWHHGFVACQTPLSMEFSRQEYWSVLPFSIPGDPPNPGIKPVSLASPELAGRFFITVWPTFCNQGALVNTACLYPTSGESILPDSQNFSQNSRIKAPRRGKDKSKQFDQRNSIPMSNTSRGGAL